MLRVILIFTLTTYIGALKLNVLPSEGSSTGSGFGIFAKTMSKTKQTGCGIVQYAFGADKYVNEGLHMSKYIRSLEVKAGWCPHDPNLDHIPVTLFTDHAGASFMRTDIPEANFAAANSSGPVRYQYEKVDIIVLAVPTEGDLSLFNCGPGVDCQPENALPAYPSKDQSVARLDGGWKLRWYHAQVLLQSPYTLTFYLDIDAVPCSGEGIAYLAKQMVTAHADIGSTVHHGSCEMAPGKTCSGNAPEGTDEKGWSKFYERNAGVIVADMTEGNEGRKIIEDFAHDIVKFAGKASGDQFAFRRSLYKHLQSSKQHIFPNDEVCRYKGSNSQHVMKKTDACAKGCKGIAHLYNNEQIKYVPKSSDIPLPKDMMQTAK